MATPTRIEAPKGDAFGPTEPLGYPHLASGSLPVRRKQEKMPLSVIGFCIGVLIFVGAILAPTIADIVW